MSARLAQRPQCSDAVEAQVKHSTTEPLRSLIKESDTSRHNQSNTIELQTRAM